MLRIIFWGGLYVNLQYKNQDDPLWQTKFLSLLGGFGSAQSRTIGVAIANIAKDRHLGSPGHFFHIPFESSMRSPTSTIETRPLLGRQRWRIHRHGTDGTGQCWNPSKLFVNFSAAFRTLPTELRRLKEFPYKKKLITQQKTRKNHVDMQIAVRWIPSVGHG